MASVLLRIVLIFAALPGIHSITSVSKVSVKAGGSVSVPCLYESKFTRHVKYLCEGFEWLPCDYKARTDQRKTGSGKYLIKDDTSQRVFTVTINHQTFEHYWCAVEIKDAPDIKTYFHLSATRGSPQLYVDNQQMTGFTGDDLTIKCRYSNTGENWWCRLGGPCVKETSGSIHGTRVLIFAEVSAFTVRMQGLRKEDAGWYFCAKGDLQMPVHVTVKQKPPTTTRQFVTFSPTTEAAVLTSTLANATGATAESGFHSTSISPLGFIICLTLLISIVIVASLLGLTLKRCRQHSKSPTTTRRSNLDSEVEVMYSSVGVLKQHTVQKVESADTNVTYSTLALK